MKNYGKLQSNFIDSILPSPDLIASSPQCNEAGTLQWIEMQKRDRIKGVTSRSREAARRDFVEACVPTGLSVTVNVCAENHKNKLSGNEKARRGPRQWMEQLRALRDLVSRVLIAGTPARLDAGTLAVKAAPSKRRNSPEFTCRARVYMRARARVCKRNHRFNLPGVAPRRSYNAHFFFLSRARRVYVHATS